MISDDRKQHIWGVANFLKEFAIKEKMKEEDVEDLFTLGLLHDIGYEFLEPQDYITHNKVGGDLLKRAGYKYWKEVYYHGVANCEYQSRFLDLLNWADMRVDSSGNVVSLDGRLEELSIRYNVPLKELDSYPIVCELKEKGFK